MLCGIERDENENAFSFPASRAGAVFPQQHVLLNRAAEALITTPKCIAAVSIRTGQSNATGNTVGDPDKVDNSIIKYNRLLHSWNVGGEIYYYRSIMQHCWRYRSRLIPPLKDLTYLFIGVEMSSALFFRMKLV